VCLMYMPASDEVQWRSRVYKHASILAFHCCVACLRL
jgi:hypothetical protein